ncbi:MAG TPA: GNAT family N-acetyltransferase [Solirubrobacteraceae bacterium]
MQSFIVRKATTTELDAVLELWADAGALPSVTDTRDGLAVLLGYDPEALLVAVRQERLVGSLVAAFDGWRANLYRLAVHPAHRREGIATAMLAEAERRLAARGARRLTAIVAEHDPRAGGFWRATGYEHQRDRARYVKHPHTP